MCDENETLISCSFMQNERALVQSNTVCHAVLPHAVWTYNRFVHTTGGCVSLCVCSVWCSEVCTSRAVRYLSLSLWGVEEPHGMREDRSPQSVRGTGEWQLSVPEAAPLPTDGAVQWTGAGSKSMALLQISGCPGSVPTTELAYLTRLA